MTGNKSRSKLLCYKGKSSKRPPADKDSLLGLDPLCFKARFPSLKIQQAQISCFSFPFVQSSSTLFTRTALILQSHFPVWTQVHKQGVCSKVTQLLYFLIKHRRNDISVEATNQDRQDFFIFETSKLCKAPTSSLKEALSTSTGSSTGSRTEF